MSMTDEIRNAEKATTQWQPEPGGIIAGVVVGIREFVSKYGKGMTADIRCENDGVVRSVLLKTVLKNEFEKQGVTVGDEVGIKYVGKTKNYHDYIVITRKIRHLSDGGEEREPWDQEEPEEEDDNKQ